MQTHRSGVGLSSSKCCCRKRTKGVQLKSKAPHSAILEEFITLEEDFEGSVSPRRTKRMITLNFEVDDSSSAHWHAWISLSFKITRGLLKRRRQRQRMSRKVFAF